MDAHSAATVEHPSEPQTTGETQQNDAVDDATALGRTTSSSATLVRLARRSSEEPARAANGRFVRVAPELEFDPQDDELPEDRFLDREISWMQFNERVLQLAADPTVPLLERTRYLSIFASNLDEFFMVRVAGLKRRIATGLAVRSASGLEPREVLDEISHAAHKLMDVHAQLFQKQLR
ncbi:MAG: RNA degradosome polyphosphate kinase, partial [Allobranchiibius sp.]